MAELNTLARPYAGAAFDLAKASDRIEAWGYALQFLAGALDHEEVQVVLSSPVIGVPQKVHNLLGLFESPPGEEIRRFINVLAENQRLELLPAIYELFDEKRAAEERTLDVTLSSAVELSEEQQARFEVALAQRLEREISLSSEIDPELIGGVLIRAGDTVFDHSVRGSLNKMQEALRRA